MTPLFILAAVAQLYTALIVPRDCTGPSAGPSLDHVVLVVNDLDRSAARFKDHGFQLKNGRLHANNLLNRHIKFRDGSSIELMTLQGEPGDAMARRYADLLAAGEGGVYVAFNIADIERAQRAATDLRLETHRSSSGPWQFLGFHPRSPAAAVFFSAGGYSANDPDSLVSHRVRTTGLTEAWLEGGPELSTLFEKMGATRCGIVSFGNLSGERLGLSHGTVVIVPRRPGIRPRVVGVVVRSEDNSDAVIRPHPELWLRYQPNSQ